MRYAFATVVAIHGLIHLMGFVKALYLTDFNKQILGISKPIGAIWLITFILFIVITVQFLTDKKWFILAFITVFISQILIILAWQDAKFGTILNSLILIVSLSALGHYRFQKMVDNESIEILTNSTNHNGKVIQENDLNTLPDIIKKWLKNSGVTNTEAIVTAGLKQKGEMRQKPNGKWMPFEAVQYTNIEKPSFIWSTKVKANTIVNLVGRDKLLNGTGEMLIKLEGLIPLVNEGNNEKINQGAMLRFLAEICWFPSASLNDYITWESLDDTSAKATFFYDNQSVSGVFSFTNEGDLISFKAHRYYGGNANAKLETWFIKTESVKTFDGIRIPNRTKIIWKLKENDFYWMNLEVTEVDFNISKRFN